MLATCPLSLLLTLFFCSGLLALENADTHVGTERGEPANTIIFGEVWSPSISDDGGNSFYTRFNYSREDLLLLYKVENISNDSVHVTIKCDLWEKLSGNTSSAVPIDYDLKPTEDEIKLECSLCNDAANDQSTNNTPSCGIYLEAETSNIKGTNANIYISIANLYRVDNQDYYEAYPSEMSDPHAFDIDYYDYARTTVVELDFQNVLKYQGKEEKDEPKDLRNYYEYIVYRIPCEITTKIDFNYKIHRCLYKIPYNYADENLSKESSCVNVEEENKEKNGNAQQTKRNVLELEISDNMCTEGSDNKSICKIYYIIKIIPNKDANTTEILDDYYFYSFVYRRLTYDKPQILASNSNSNDTNNINMDIKYYIYNSNEYTESLSQYSMVLCVKGCDIQNPANKNDTDSNYTDNNSPATCSDPLHEILDKSSSNSNSLDVLTETIYKAGLGISSDGSFSPPNRDMYISIPKEKNVCILSSVDGTKRNYIPMVVDRLENNFVIYSCTLLSLTTDDNTTMKSDFTLYNPACFEIPVSESTTVETSSISIEPNISSTRTLIKTSNRYRNGKLMNDDPIIVGDEIDINSDTIMIKTTDKTVIMSVISTKNVSKVKARNAMVTEDSNFDIPKAYLVTCDYSIDGNFLNMCPMSSRKRYTMNGISILKLESYTFKTLGNVYSIEGGPLTLYSKISNINEMNENSPFILLKNNNNYVNLVNLGKYNENRPLGVKFWYGSLNNESKSVCVSLSKIDECNMITNNTTGNEQYATCDGDINTRCIDVNNEGTIFDFSIFGDILTPPSTSDSIGANNSTEAPQYVSMMVSNKDQNEPICGSLIDSSYKYKYLKIEPSKKVRVKPLNDKLDVENIVTKAIYRLSFDKAVIASKNANENANYNSEEDDDGGDDDNVGDNGSYRYYIYGLQDEENSNKVDKDKLNACYVAHSGKFKVEERVTEDVSCTTKNGKTKCNLEIPFERESRYHILIVIEKNTGLIEIYDPFKTKTNELPSVIILLIVLTCIMFAAMIAFIVVIRVRVVKQRKINRMREAEEDIIYDDNNN